MSLFKNQILAIIITNTLFLPSYNNNFFFSFIAKFMRINFILLFKMKLFDPYPCVTLMKYCLSL